MSPPQGFDPRTVQLVGSRYTNNNQGFFRTKKLFKNVPPQRKEVLKNTDIYQVVIRGNTDIYQVVIRGNESYRRELPVEVSVGLGPYTLGFRSLY
jgi:hypothetical protein